MHQGLGFIATAYWEFSSASFKRQKIPRDKRQVWKDVKSSDYIKIIQYMAPNVPPLTKAILKPLVQVSIKSYTVCPIKIPVSRRQNFQAKINETFRHKYTCSNDLFNRF